MKVIKTKQNKRKTIKKRSSPTNQYSQQHITLFFLEMLNTVKLYHWKTHSFAQHKATDELYTELNEKIDTFIEVMLGKTGDRVNLTKYKSIPLNDYSNLQDFQRKIEQYKVFLIKMTNAINLNITNNSDLLNIRDEILGILNKFTYLLTFH
jgi:DNA-binding ferritin-like protein